jgi:phosphate transport system permease protein
VRDADEPKPPLRTARRRRGRRWADRLFLAVVAACAAVAVGVLLAILAAILARGLPAVGWRFLTEPVALAGAAGGIFYNLVGTLILIGTAAAVTAPVAVGVALTHGVYLPPGRARRGLALLLYVLNGVPSILFGISG